MNRGFSNNVVNYDLCDPKMLYSTCNLEEEFCREISFKSFCIKIIEE